MWIVLFQFCIILPVVTNHFEGYRHFVDSFWFLLCFLKLFAWYFQSFQSQTCFYDPMESKTSLAVCVFSYQSHCHESHRAWISRTLKSLLVFLNPRLNKLTPKRIKMVFEKSFLKVGLYVGNSMSNNVRKWNDCKPPFRISGRKTIASTPSKMIFVRRACLKWKRQPIKMAGGNSLSTTFIKPCSKSEVVVAALRSFGAVKMASFRAALRSFGALQNKSWEQEAVQILIEPYRNCSPQTIETFHFKARKAALG